MSGNFSKKNEEKIWKCKKTCSFAKLIIFPAATFLIPLTVANTKTYHNIPALPNFHNLDNVQHSRLKTYGCGRATIFIKLYFSMQTKNLNWCILSSIFWSHNGCCICSFTFQTAQLWSPILPKMLCTKGSENGLCPQPALVKPGPSHLWSEKMLNCCLITPKCSFQNPSIADRERLHNADQRLLGRREAAAAGLTTTKLSAFYPEANAGRTLKLKLFLKHFCFVPEQKYWHVPITKSSKTSNSIGNETKQPN